MAIDDVGALDDGIDRRRRRDGIDVRVEEQRRAGRRRRNARVEVAGVTAELCTGVVLDCLHPERRQLRAHVVDRSALAAGRRRQAGELEEQFERRGHG